MSRRTRANEAGVNFVLKLRAEHGEPTTDLNPVTPSEELELICFYAYKLAAKGVDLWPRKVIATAVTFLKRFYLKHSIIQHEVTKIAFACLYIAGKVCLISSRGEPHKGSRVMRCGLPSMCSQQ